MSQPQTGKLKQCILQCIATKNKTDQAMRKSVSDTSFEILSAVNDLQQLASIPQGQTVSTLGKLTAMDVLKGTTMHNGQQVKLASGRSFFSKSSKSNSQYVPTAQPVSSTQPVATAQPLTKKTSFFGFGGKSTRRRKHKNHSKKHSKKHRKRTHKKH